MSLRTTSPTPPPLPDEQRPSGVFGKRIVPSISVRSLAGLLRRAGLAYRSGVDLLKIWEQEQTRGRPRHQAQMAIVYAGIRNGKSVHESMEDCHGYFPKLTQSLVKVGERAGRLDRVLLQLADHYDHVLRMRREFIAAVAWPAIQLTLAVAVIGLLIWIMGAILPGEVDILGWGLMGTAGLITYLFMVSSVVAAVALFVTGLLRGWFGPGPIQIAMRIWGIGGALQNFALARLSWCLASALEAGVGARESIELALESTNNVYYMRHIPAVGKAIQGGDEFHSALRETHAFPDEFLDALENAELSGTHSESMMLLSEDYADRARLSSTLITKLATYLTWFIVAGIIISLIFRLAFFYLNTINSALEF